MALSRHMATQRKINSVKADKEDLEKDFEDLEDKFANVPKTCKKRERTPASRDTKSNVVPESSKSDTRSDSDHQVCLRPDSLSKKTTSGPTQNKDSKNNPEKTSKKQSVSRPGSGSTKSGQTAGTDAKSKGPATDTDDSRSASKAAISAKPDTHIGASPSKTKRKNDASVKSGSDKPDAGCKSESGPAEPVNKRTSKNSQTPVTKPVSASNRTKSRPSSGKDSESDKKFRSSVLDDSITTQVQIVEGKVSQNPTARENSAPGVKTGAKDKKTSIANRNTSEVLNGGETKSVGTSSPASRKRTGPEKRPVADDKSKSSKVSFNIEAKPPDPTGQSSQESGKGGGDQSVPCTKRASLDPESKDSKLFYKRKPKVTSGFIKPPNKRAQSAKGARTLESKSTTFDKRPKSAVDPGKTSASLDLAVKESGTDGDDESESSAVKRGDKHPADGKTNRKKTKILQRMMETLDIENRLKGLKGADKSKKESLNLASKQRSSAAREGSSYRSRLPVHAYSHQQSQRRPICDPEVALWLRSLNLKDTDRYINIFTEHEVDMECLLLITDEQLKEMGIRAVGAYTKILQAIHDIREQKTNVERRRKELEDRLSHSGDSSRSDADSQDGDRSGGRSHIVPRQTNKAVLLRQNLMQERQKSQRKPWMNPNRNNYVKSKIDTGLHKAEVQSDSDLIDVLHPVTSSKTPCQSSHSPPSGNSRLMLRASMTRSLSEDRGIHNKTAVMQGIQPIGGSKTQTRCSPSSNRYNRDRELEDLIQDTPSYKFYLSDSDSDDNDIIMNVDVKRTSLSRDSITDVLPLTLQRRGSDRRRSDSEVTSGVGKRKPPVVMAKPAATRKSVALGMAKFGLAAGKPVSPPPSEMTSSPSLPSCSQTPMTSRGTSASSRASREELSRNSVHDAAAALAQIEGQLQHLHDNPDDTAAMPTIERLQQQLQQLQDQVSAQAGALNAATPQRAISSIRLLPKGSGDPDEGWNDNHDDNADTLVPTAIEPSKKTSPQSIKKAASPQTSTRGRYQPLNKPEMLREVRKQREDYRKQIRLLEGEVSRLKHRDPLRHVEIKEDEVDYGQAGLIGEGAFSQVFRGSYLGSEVAIKRLKVPLLAQDKNYFMAEVSLLRELRHPRVVLLLGVCTTSSHPIMVLEYLPKGSLYYYLHDPDIPSLDHLAYYQIARDTSLGMNYLHQHRPCVLHLDLKSMNILLTQHLRAKIADFGFSKLRHDASEVAHKSGGSQPGSGIQGTPAWMAPELFDGGCITTKADVYSFGIILWEMLTRQHPYHGCSMFQIMERARQGHRPDLPSCCPQPLALVINRCWNQNPSKRPAFRDVVPMLERLHFPPEWRALFDAAGVPPAALEDIHSTRTLVDIVAQSLEAETLTKLRRDFKENDSGRGVSPPDHPVVLPIQTYPSEGVEELNDMEDGADRESGVFEASRPSSIARSYRSASITNDLTYPNEGQNMHLLNSMMPPPGPPPPPPPLPPPVLPPLAVTHDSSPMNDPFTFDLHANLANVTLKHVAECPTGSKVASSPSGVPFIAADLMQQKMRLKAPDPVSSPVPKPTESGFYINPADLMTQKGRLKHVDTPAPSQLKDLSTIDGSQLHNIADILKKAMSGRRQLMNAGAADSLDQSMTSIMWSFADD